ncbi:MAG: hypothetical protein MRERV_19c029 [Mycoplasmataceae bacterium RV_VA103A]|nr:MAG: hypothetical protein MRERV_19c029 [Mycoplasmataceae bacterium RV_VA103A]
MILVLTYNNIFYLYFNFCVFLFTFTNKDQLQ